MPDNMHILTNMAFGTNAKGEHGYDPNVSVCPRCGIEFDSSDFVPFSPCRDCQWDYPDEEFRKLSIVREQERNRQDALLAKYTGGMNSDREVADMLGVSRSVVQVYRNAHDVKAHQIREGANYGYRRVNKEL